MPEEELYDSAFNDSLQEEDDDVDIIREEYNEDEEEGHDSNIELGYLNDADIDEHFMANFSQFMQRLGLDVEITNPTPQTNATDDDTELIFWTEPFEYDYDVNEGEDHSINDPDEIDIEEGDGVVPDENNDNSNIIDDDDMRIPLTIFEMIFRNNTNTTNSTTTTTTTQTSLDNNMNNNASQHIDFDVTHLLERIFTSVLTEEDNDMGTNVAAEQERHQIIQQHKDAWDLYQQKQAQSFGTYPKISKESDDNIETPASSLSCFICLESKSKQWYASQCGHVYCGECVENLIKTRKEHLGCCVCRQPWLFTKLFTPEN